MFSGWKRLRFRVISWWRRYCHEKWLRHVDRHVEKFKHELFPYYALEAKLLRLSWYPSIHYNYRIGAQTRLSLYHKTWPDWQQNALVVANAIDAEKAIEDVVIQRAFDNRTCSLDDFLLGYAPETLVLDDYLEEVKRDGLALLKALRIAHQSSNKSKSSHYMTRSYRIVHDLDVIVSALIALAMDPYHVK